MSATITSISPLSIPESAVRHHWNHAPGLSPLNHGSFGACPVEVLERQRGYRDQMERDGVEWFVRGAWGLIDASREKLAPHMGADPDDLVFIPNATLGVAAAIANLERSGFFQPGDELLVNDHEYSACLAQFRALAERQKLLVRVAKLPFSAPNLSAEELDDLIVQTLLEQTTSRTKLCLLSLVTSPSALHLPAGRIIRELRQRGAETILDAAHGLGLLPVQAEELGAAFTVSNAHKWLCGPKSCALMHVRRDLRKQFEQRSGGFRPLALSVHAVTPSRGACTKADGRARSRFQFEFDYVGTQDVTPWITAGDAADILPQIWDELRDAESTPEPSGWSGLMARNRRLALRGREILMEALGTPAPLPTERHHAIAVATLPEHPPEVFAKVLQHPTCYADPLQERLVETHRIQVPLWRWERGEGQQPLRFIRLSAFLYNTEDEYHRLAQVLVEELERERSLT